MSRSASTLSMAGVPGRVARTARWNGPRPRSGAVRRGLLALIAGCVLLSSSVPALGAPLPGVRTAKVGEIRIAYRATGSGRPLLLINGSGATLDTWDPALLKALNPGHRIIVFDPRGMAGSTDAPRSP